VGVWRELCKRTEMEMEMEMEMAMAMEMTFHPG
jgi:hypothetical protein